jgi:hypothetical protein
MRRRPIYVECRIGAPIDEVWSATQEPASHARWDVRFGKITYLPRLDDQPQRFTYSTQVLPGMKIAGTGESLGDRSRPDGTRWSGLRFWAEDRRSIIEAGAGYWRYIPAEDGVRFLTRYDYRPRWGRVGETLDRWLFRPVFGWATAWSFDRLRLWLEEGIPPERSRNRAIAHALALAGVVVACVAGVVRVSPGGQSQPPAVPGAAPRVKRLARRWAMLMVCSTAAASVAATTSSGAPSGRRPLRVAPDRQPEVGPLP